MATENETPPESSTSPGLIVFGYCIGFVIPLAIIYNLFYHKQGGMRSLVLVYAGAYFMGLIFSLLYYRTVIMQKSGDIAKMDNSTVKKVMLVNIASYSIVAVTIFALAINPSLVNIFENTVGYTFLGMKGLHALANEIFVSNELREIQENGDFDYDFLITRFGVNDIGTIEKYFEDKSRSDAQQNMPKLPTYFQMELNDHDQLFKFTNLIYLKHTVGHFTWIYLTSIIAMLISMVTLSMK